MCSFFVQNPYPVHISLRQWVTISKKIIFSIFVYLLINFDVLQYFKIAALCIYCNFIWMKVKYIRKEINLIFLWQNPPPLLHLTSPYLTTRLPTSRLPASRLPTSLLPTSRLPTSRLPTSRHPTSRLPTSRLPSCRFFRDFWYCTNFSRILITVYSKIFYIVFEPAGAQISLWSEKSCAAIIKDSWWNSFGQCIPPVQFIDY